MWIWILALKKKKLNFVDVASHARAIVCKVNDHCQTGDNITDAEFAS